MSIGMQVERCEGMGITLSMRGAMEEVGTVERPGVRPIGPVRDGLCTLETGTAISIPLPLIATTTSLATLRVGWNRERERETEGTETDVEVMKGDRPFPLMRWSRCRWST